MQFCWDVNADLVGLVAVMRLHLSLLLQGVQRGCSAPHMIHIHTSTPLSHTHTLHTCTHTHFHLPHHTHLLWLLPQSSHGCRELHGGLAVHSFPPCHNQLHLGILPTCRGKSLAECVQGLLVGVTQQGLTVDAKQVVILAEPAILQ